jgi:serine/threonine protein phosphatase PrpC
MGCRKKFGFVSNHYFLKICNLPDHPIHAGCTAVCAVIVGTTLTVANAGDSRVVLCRNDQSTEAMSFDHKPSHQIERNRITEAGGFVNQFGRVNGNLNLSRSIGDLKYKQVPNIAPPDQMITAEPDIKSVTLNPDDEFVILACDVSFCTSYSRFLCHAFIMNIDNISYLNIYRAFGIV